MNPFLTTDCCEALLEAGARFAGIDSLNIDDTEDLTRPAHTILLGAGIPVCEHMTNLQALPESEGRLHAVPIAVEGRCNVSGARVRDALRRQYPDWRTPREVAVFLLHPDIVPIFAGRWVRIGISEL